MKEQFVPYEIALKLKEKGFKQPKSEVEISINHYYSNKGVISSYQYFSMNDVEKFNKNLDWTIYAPLWQQVIDWFLIEHEIYIYIARDGGWWIVNIKDLSREEDEGAIDIELKGHFSNCFDELPKAKQAAIEHALTLI